MTKTGTQRVTVGNDGKYREIKGLDEFIRNALTTILRIECLVHFFCGYVNNLIFQTKTAMYIAKNVDFITFYVWLFLLKGCYVGCMVIILHTN